MPLTNDQLRAIGRISVAYNTLEIATHLIASKLLNRDLEIGLRALAGENLARMLDKVRYLSEYVARNDPELLARIKGWADRAGSVRQRRNDVFHSSWTEDEETGEMVALRLTSREPKTAQTQPTDLDQLAEDIDSVWVEGAKLVGAITGLYRQQQG